MDCKYKLPCGWCEKFDRECKVGLTTIKEHYNIPNVLQPHVLQPPYIATCDTDTKVVLGGYDNSVTAANNTTK